MEELINFQLTNNEYLIIIKALITQNAINGVVDKELAELISKLSGLSTQ